MERCFINEYAYLMENKIKIKAKEKMVIHLIESSKYIIHLANLKPLSLHF